MTNNGQSRVLCVGAAHWDIIGRAGTTVHFGDDVPGKIERRPGGVAFNVATGLADHNCRVSLCTAIGEDDDGRALIDHATSRGVDCRHVVEIPGASSQTYLAIENNAGELVAAVADQTLLENHAEAVIRQVQSGLQEATAVFVDANLPAPAIARVAGLAHEHDIELIANPVSPTGGPPWSG